MISLAHELTVEDIVCQTSEAPGDLLDVCTVATAGRFAQGDGVTANDTGTVETAVAALCCFVTNECRIWAG